MVMLVPPEDAQGVDNVNILWVYNHHEFLDAELSSG